MPLIGIHEANPMSDGRQSQKALMIQRSMIRYLEETGHAALAEFPLSSGRRADILALDRKGRFTLIEIKSSIGDFRVDRKWPEYAAFCDCFAFATWHGVPVDIFPESEGLFVADAYYADVLREPSGEPMHASSRRALTLRFARLAARRAERITRYAETNNLLGGTIVEDESDL